MTDTSAAASWDDHARPFRIKPTNLGDIARLWRTCMSESVDVEELRWALCDAAQPVMAYGNVSTGIIATTRNGDAGFLRLLLVHPTYQRKGLGNALLLAAEKGLQGCTTITAGTDVPYYLFPGVMLQHMPMLCLLEKHRYRRVGANLNLSLDLKPWEHATPSDRVATVRSSERTVVQRWSDQHWPEWTAEFQRALDRETLLAARDEDGEIGGLCAYDVNRRGWLGPIGVRHELLGTGLGRILLNSALAGLFARGGQTVAIAWVGPLRPYIEIGACVGDTYLVYRKEPQTLHPVDQKRKAATMALHGVAPTHD